MPSPLDQPESTTPSRSPAPDDGPSTVAAPPTTSAAPTSSAPAHPLAIEYDDTKGSRDEKEEIQSLDLGEGNVIKLDKLGPMIVNSDGTLSRIQNWQDLHPIEQERTVRLLVKKRNLVRLQKLDAENNETGEEKLSALGDNSSAPQ